MPIRPPEWLQDWRGQTAVVVASGPSAKMVDLEEAKGKARFIAVNNSWKLAPWADVLYACDVSWWDLNHGCPEFQGLKLSKDQSAQNRWRVGLVDSGFGDDRINLEPTAKVGWGGNSGFGAMNLAAKFGAKKIVLVGFDMTTAYGIHWHGRHPEGMHNPTESTTMRWRRSFPEAAQYLADNGIEVLNCSPVSTLTCFPKMPFQQAMAPEFRNASIEAA